MELEAEQGPQQISRRDMLSQEPLMRAKRESMLKTKTEPTSYWTWNIAKNKTETNIKTKTELEPKLKLNTEARVGTQARVNARANTRDRDNAGDKATASCYGDTSSKIIWMDFFIFLRSHSLHRGGGYGGFGGYGEWWLWYWEQEASYE